MDPRSEPSRSVSTTAAPAAGGSQVARRSRPRGGSLVVLRHAEFRTFWIGFGVAVLGFQIQRVGLGFLAYDITGSAFFLALVFSGDSIPMIVLSPVGGVIGDRINRRLVLIVSRSCVAVLALAFAGLTTAGTIETWHLLLFALLTGICYAIDVPARQAMVHDLVPHDELIHAIALTATLRQASRIVGPAIGGLALLLVGVQGAFALMAVGQLIAVWSVLLLRLPHVPRLEQTSVSADLLQGFRYIAGHRVIRTLMLVSAIPALTAMAYQAMTPVFAIEVLGRGGSAIGVMLAAAGVGALAGSMLVTALPDRMAKPSIAMPAAILFGLIVSAFALSRYYPLSLLLLAGAGMSNAVYTIGVSSAIQRRSPPAMQARVMGVYQTTWELQVIAALAVGALADAIGAPAGLALAGAISVGAVAALLLMRAGDETRAGHDVTHDQP
ncbi:MAG: MFS transporter [Dehalococcoidia bacterium]